MNAMAPAIAHYHTLDKELDRAKTDLFTTKYAAFYGSLLCSLNFYWSDKIPTAATNGVDLLWNVEDFLRCTPGQRKTTLRHEVEHCSRLHFDRQQGRDHTIWNHACDYRINNDMQLEGYEVEGMGMLIDQKYGPEMSEEEIYEDLDANGIPVPQFVIDMLTVDPNGIPLTKDQRAQAINNIVRAVQQAKLGGGNNVPGNVETMLTTFLAPVVPWQQVLHGFFTELSEDGYTWSKPNRRYSDLYLPSRYMEEGALSNLAYFEDISGSISDQDMVRFNSELKHVFETYKPEKMTLLQFDMVIKHEQVYTPDDTFDHVIRHGSGGTGWACVREYVIKHRPTAVVIFTDMGFWDPIESFGFDIPVLWVVINAPGAKAPFGKLTYIR